MLSERETESVGKALTVAEGAPLTKLTLLEAESDSLVQSLLKICSFWKRSAVQKKKGERIRTNCAKDMKF